MRYFYKDPLAAAWMAKHFGMKFLAKSTDDEGAEIEVDAGLRFIDFDDRFDELWKHDFCYLGKLYIRPDSVHLLDHRIDDLVRMVYMDDSVGFVVLDEYDFTHQGMIDSMRNLTINPVVLQRNGIPFHWPEVEA